MNQEADDTAHRIEQRGPDVPVIVIAGALTVALVLAGLLFSDQVRVAGLHAYAFIADWLGWLFVLATAGFVLLIVYLAIGRYGRVKLGSPQDRPEYSTFSWISMMFALGVGIGLIFYGAYEPVLLWAEPPPGGPPARSDDAAVAGLRYSIFHWAVHPWAFFGVTGLVFAYSTLNKGRPSLVSATLRPLAGWRQGALLGRGIDAWVVVTTLVGNSVTLGLGTLQVVAGLGFLAKIDPSDLLMAVVVGVLTVAFVISAAVGIDRGIKRLADFNVMLAIALMVYLFVLGPTRLILDLLPEAAGEYIANFVQMSFQTGALDTGPWMQTWTIFFWAWGISWAPYVGSFLAKISRGRTIREYVAGVLVAPSLATIVWFAVLGGTALDLQLSGTRDVVASVAESAEAALFDVLEAFPLSGLTTVVVVVLAAVFFVSGADAGAMVLGTFSSRGDPEPQRWLVVSWGLLVGLVALALLVVGGLDALQWGALVVASPFVLVLIAMCVALLKDLRADHQPDTPSANETAVDHH